MDIQTAIQHILDRKNLEPEQMRQVMRAIMTGACSPAQIAGFLIGLRMKGETVDEITAATQIMRELSTRVEAGGVIVQIYPMFQQLPPLLPPVPVHVLQNMETGRFPANPAVPMCSKLQVSGLN